MLYTVPVITTSAVPGVVAHVPFSFCVYCAAGTVICPGSVANTPVVSPYVYCVPAAQAVPLNVTAMFLRIGSNVSVSTMRSASEASVLPVFSMTNVYVICPFP